jgi:hypothetical protein
MSSMAEIMTQQQQYMKSAYTPYTLIMIVRPTANHSQGGKKTKSLSELCITL